jgi:large subunit ribosomal protein L10
MSDGYAVKVRPEKVEEVQRIRAELDSSQFAVITEYRGLTVEALKALRTRLLDTDSSYRVTKNTLARLAANELGLGELDELFEGPVAVAYVKGDPIAAAKVIATFAREHPELVIKGGVLDGRVISGDEAKGLATIDPLDVSRAKIAGMLTAPLQQMMMLLEAPTARILFVLEEIGRRGEAEAAPEPEAAAEAEAAAEPEAEAPVEEATQTEDEPKEETKEEGAE